MPRYTPRPAARLQDQDTPKRRSSPMDPREAETLAALCMPVTEEMERDVLLGQNGHELKPTWVLGVDNKYFKHPWQIGGE